MARPSLGRLGPVVAGLLAIALTIVPSSARPVLAAETLRLAVDATYTLDPEAGRVRGALDVAATNLKPSTPTTVFYYDEIFLGVHQEATRIRASDGTGALEATVRDREDYTAVTVNLRSRLFYGDTARFVVRYDLPGAEPRSASPIRVGAAFSTFGVWAWGDIDRSSVEVRLPPGFEASVLGDAMEVTREPDGWRLRAQPVDPYRFYSVVDAENESAYERTPVSLVGGVELVVLGWPEDDAWQERVATPLRLGMPVLQALIGLDWPVRHELEVRERYTPALEGYAGVFYADESIDLSEDLDPLVIVHEASHAWFNEDLFVGRWIYEGLAQEYAWRVMSSVGEAGEPPARPSPADPAAIALTSWSHPGVIRDQETDDYERYGYGASWWVVHEIVAVVGEDRMRWAFDSAIRNTTAYIGAGPPEEHPGQDGFARFYDLVEDISEPPSARLDEAFRTFVMSADQVSLLDARRDARAAYRDLVAAGEGWLPPWYVRRPLDDWQFPLATDRIGEARGVLDLRDEVERAAGDLGLQPDGTLRAAYESARANFQAATELGDEQLDALGAIDEARLRLAAERDLLTTIGLFDATPEAPYEQARAAFEDGDLELAASLAASSVATIAGAAAIGQQRLLIAVAVALAVLILLLVLVAWRRRRRRAATAVVAASAGPYGTLAGDRSGAPEPPNERPVEVPAAEMPLEGGTAEGGTPGER
ncbi:MAG: M1 family metallopeptidase [Chloroflexi bacterium]|nr:M1 family metallopeptidase [Chloroflexota bacterium]